VGLEPTLGGAEGNSPCINPSVGRRPQGRRPLVSGGVLYIVGTPIGNLGDITVRALEVLRTVPAIAAEDTRVTRRLLSHFEIPTPRHFVSYREDNRERGAEKVLGLLREGLSVALVTDAGMPCVSDPGDFLVARCHQEGIPVTAVPGASAFLAAVAVAGIGSSRLAFEGFLSRRGSHRRARLAELARETRTMVFFEAPSRVAQTLQELSSTLGADRRACVAREITKKFEEIVPGTLGWLVDWSLAKEMRGEFVIVVEGGVAEAASCEDAATLLREAIQGGMSRSEAARAVAQKLGLQRRDVYALGDGD